MERLPETYQVSETFDFKGESFNYEVIGDGPVKLVFLHGFAMSLNAWNDIKYKFSKDDYTLILVDLKGCGFSSRVPQGDYSLVFQAEMLIAMMKHLGIAYPVIIGHSYGGLVALYIEHILRKNVSGITLQKLVLLDAPAYTEYVPGFLKALKNPLLSFITLNMVSAGWNAGFIIKTTFYHWQEALKRLHKRYTFFLDRPGTNESLRMLALQVMPADADELVKGYKDIRIPVLVLWGAQDKLIPILYGQRLCEDIPGAGIVSLPGCGHVPHEECPELTYVHIIRFLESNRQ